MTPHAPVLRIESRKLYASPVARTAACAVLIMATATSAGGYAAAVHAPGTDMGRKAAAMISGQGWSGYVSLAALSLGVTLWFPPNRGGLLYAASRLGAAVCS